MNTASRLLFPLRHLRFAIFTHSNEIEALWEPRAVIIGCHADSRLQNSTRLLFPRRYLVSMGHPQLGYFFHRCHAKEKSEMLYTPGDSIIFHSVFLLDVPLCAFSPQTCSQNTLLVGLIFYTLESKQSDVEAYFCWYTTVLSQYL